MSNLCKYILDYSIPLNTILPEGRFTSNMSWYNFLFSNAKSQFTMEIARNFSLGFLLFLMLFLKVRTSD
jgi:hypothetical protein